MESGDFMTHSNTSTFSFLTAGMIYIWMTQGLTELSKNMRMLFNIVTKMQTLVLLIVFVIRYLNKL